VSVGITSNIDDLKQALLIYEKVVKKEATKAMYNKMGDVAFSASEGTYFTTPEKIRNEISNLPVTKDGGISRKGSTRFVGQYKLINWQRKLAGLKTLGNSQFRKVTSYRTRKGSMVVEERTSRKRNQIGGHGPAMPASKFMDGKYKKFIQTRTRASKLLRIGWACAAAAFGKKFTRGDFGSATLKRLSNEGVGGGSFQMLNESIGEFKIFNGAGQYDSRRKKPYPRRPSADLQRAYKIMQDGLTKGIDTVLNDPKRGIVPYLEARYERTQKAIGMLRKMKAI